MSGRFELLTGCDAARCDLHDRGKLQLTGTDRARFLNGMVTNDVDGLAPGDACHALQLSRQGKVQAELVVLKLEDRLILDVAPGAVSVLRELLERHLVADDVTIEELGGLWGHVGLEGPGVLPRLRERKLPQPAADGIACQDLKGEFLVWLGGGSLGDEGVQVMGPRAAVERVVATLDLQPVPDALAELLRIESFRPRFGVDFGERNVANELQLERALSFAKGCYLGQEVVERLRSRKAVRRLLCQIRTERPVDRGARICVDDAEVGEITSAANSSVTGPVALGYVRAQHARPGVRLAVDGTSGVITGPSSSAAAP
ncbi:MAG: YgfZ/GcvT domain-containing protein [Myxococcota bacterium]